jgi:hypothetical protein
MWAASHENRRAQRRADLLPRLPILIALTGDLHTFFSSKALGNLLERSLALAALRRWSGPPASFVTSDGSPSLVDVKVRHSRSGLLQPTPARLVP